MGEATEDPLHDLAQAMENAEAAIVRLLLVRAGEELCLRRAVVNVFPDAGDASEFLYDYGHATLGATVQPGASVMRWMREGRGRLGALEFVLPRLGTGGITDRRPSHTAALGSAVVPWPHTDLHMMASDGGGAFMPGREFLVADGCPFYPDVYRAAAELVYEARQPALSWEFPSPVVLARIANDEAWIESVRISPSTVTVAVEGRAVAGANLEVAGEPNFRAKERLGQPGPVTFSLRAGLPENCWIVLSRKDAWLDYRHWSSQPSPFSPKVENITWGPETSAERIEWLRSRGEGETLEFKESVPTKDKNLSKVVAAFANGSGGSILVGIKDRTGEITGVPAEQVGPEKDHIGQLLRDNLNPQPTFSCTELEVDGKWVIVMDVHSGHGRLFAVGDRNRPEYYVRRGATTFHAQPEDIRQIIAPHNVSASPLGL